MFRTPSHQPDVLESRLSANEREHALMARRPRATPRRPPGRFIDPPGSIEARIRSIIKQRTSAHGRRAAVSRALGLHRGWVTEYVTGKIKHLTIDELAAVASALALDLPSLLAGEAPGAEVPLVIDQLLRLRALWPAVPADERVLLVQLIARAAASAPSTRGRTARGSVPLTAVVTRKVAPRARRRHG